MWAEQLETCTTDVTVWNSCARRGADCSKDPKWAVRRLRSRDSCFLGQPVSCAHRDMTAHQQSLCRMSTWMHKSAGWNTVLQ